MGDVPDSQRDAGFRDPGLLKLCFLPTMIYVEAELGPASWGVVVTVVHSDSIPKHVSRDRLRA